MHLCSRRFIAVAALALFTSPAGLAQPAAPPQQAPAQAPPPRTSQSTSQTTGQAAAAGNGIQEKQLPLDVDRDPIRSPDAAAPAPAAAPQSGEAAATAPQQGQDLSRGAGGRYTLHRDVDEVVLNATVLDDKRHLVSNLTKPDFHVYEDGVPQTIASFQHQDIPISLGILVDNSGSMRTKRQAVNKAALDLVRASNPQDETFIVNFADESYIDQDFTPSVDKLREGLARIDSKGGTALYDSIMASADYLTKNAKRPKQVLLVITDGEDNASSTTLEESVRRIQDLDGPVVYSIGLLFDDEGGGHETRRARRALDMLSTETGGVAFFPKNLNQVDEIAAEVARDIREQYTIGYHSTKPAKEGGFRTVRVDAKANGYGRLTVRTRTGYYPHVKGTSAPATAGQAAADQAAPAQSTHGPGR